MNIFSSRQFCFQVSLANVWKSINILFHVSALLLIFSFKSRVPISLFFGCFFSVFSKRKKALITPIYKSRTVWPAMALHVLNNNRPSTLLQAIFQNLNNVNLNNDRDFFSLISKEIDCYQRYDLISLSHVYSIFYATKCNPLTYHHCIN